MEVYLQTLSTKHTGNDEIFFSFGNYLLFWQYLVGAKSLCCSITCVRILLFYIVYEHIIVILAGRNIYHIPITVMFKTSIRTFWFVKLTFVGSH